MPDVVRFAAVRPDGIQLIPLLLYVYLQNLVVSNGGLGNGVSREVLLEVLREGGAVETLLMPPNKPYAYVTYASVEDGQRAHRLLSGRVLKSQGQEVTLYFSYVDKGKHSTTM